MYIVTYHCCVCAFVIPYPLYHPLHYACGSVDRVNTAVQVSMYRVALGLSIHYILFSFDST